MKRSLKDTIRVKEKTGAGTESLPGDLGALADRYKGLSESELMMNLLTETRRRKADGSFDMESVRSGMNAILPMLDEGQKSLFAWSIGDSNP